MASHNPPLVAHVIYALSTGGLENGLVNIINRAPAERYQHVIICITQADHFVQRITAEGVRVIELHKRPGHDFGFYWRLCRLFWELRPDIIHSRNLAALETQLLSLGCPGVRRVHGEHGREENDLAGTNWKYLGFRKFMRPMIDRYIAVSKDLECWLANVVRIRQEKIRQIYNGVDHERFSPDIVKPLAILPRHWRVVDGTLVVGTVGRLTPVKNQQSLLRGVARLRELAPGLFGQVRVLLIGDGSLRRTLAELVDELDLEDIVWLTGDRKDIPSMLLAMDLFVLPSLGEGISNTVLEAMASGLPVIATDVGGNGELVEDGFNGRLVPVGDLEALAAALKELLENEQERKRRGANARQRVSQRFDWNRTVEQYLGVYDELLGQRTPEPGAPGRAPQNI